MLFRSQVLDISNNQLIGQIPQCLGDFSNSLLVLNLRNNRFHGNLSETFIEGSNLKTLDFSYNQIQGKIPRSLVKCKMLEVLNLGNNNKNDTFPFWLESSPELQILILPGNGFHGAIWDAHNNFSGKLPSQYFKTWTGMVIVPDKDMLQPKYMGDDFYYKDSITVMNKCLEMELLRISIIFTSIDLSNNRFHGDILDTLGILKALIVLNLSSNSFTSPIPSSLGSLIELESLDLSQNKLSGEIPQELTSLTFLEYLNLSRNNLKGPIPQNGQFGTIENSSFEGNLRLYDFPLTKKCESHDTPTPKSSQEASLGEAFDWIVVIIG